MDDVLSSNPKRPVEEEVENWDDGDFMMVGEDLALRSNSSVAGTSRRRDSTSSRMSFRSDLESWAGDEENHVQIHGDDEASHLDAISAAHKAGIPISQGVPSSALMGGTIKRLGGRKIRTIMHEDWETDLEIPEASQGFKMKPQDQLEFPETLRQVSDSSVQGSPPKPTLFASGQTQQDEDVFGGIDSRIKTASVDLDKFKDEDDDDFFGGDVGTIKATKNDHGDLGKIASEPRSPPVDLDKFKDDDDDDFFGGGGDTIKVAKRQPPKPVSLITPPTPQKPADETQKGHDFEEDLELPTDGNLRLSTRRDIPKTPSYQADDLDWGEGSLGTRYGGTRRDGRSNRSSSASALSPSVSSSITAESEDETFDGLVLPTGPVNFQEMLQHRKKNRSPERIPEEQSPPKKQAPAEADQPGFLDDLDIGDGDVFSSKKLTLHKNVKVKDTRPSSPARPKTAASVTFTNKTPPSGSTRIPRLSHDRTHSTSLEPVSESGGPILQRARRPQSRLGGHATQSSVSSIPTPTTPSSVQHSSPPTPSTRREPGAKSSTPALRGEPTTTNAQLLKQKRSLPAIRALNPPARPLGRPPSRDSGIPQSVMRPKTPVDRQRPLESPAASRRANPPFMHTGSSHAPSRIGRQFRRYDSENAIDFRPHSRNISRATMRSPSPQRYRVAADTWERLSRPKNKKNFGDGHELDAFDDLPTSKETETRFMKQPVATSSSRPTLRHRNIQNVMPEGASTPTPTSQSHKGSTMPRFARDTAASRIARETSLAHRSTSSLGGPLAQINAQRGPPLSSRGNINTQTLQQPPARAKKSKRPPQLKPHLISNLSSGKESKLVNGMFYNPETFRWEGNENALNAFDTQVSTPTTITATSHAAREKEMPTPRPALITNISATKGIQVVNGMVFDPENMCWMKVGAQKDKTKPDANDPLEKLNAFGSDDDDVFKDIPDLQDNPADEERGPRGRVSDVNDDWLVGEEFDVGPEFVRRQREEEDRWRKKCEKWAGRGVRDRETWRWTIRELVSQFDELAM